MFSLTAAGKPSGPPRACLPAPSRPPPEAAGSRYVTAGRAGVPAPRREGRPRSAATYRPHPRQHPRSGRRGGRTLTFPSRRAASSDRPTHPQRRRHRREAEGAAGPHLSGGGGRASPEGSGRQLTARGGDDGANRVPRAALWRNPRRAAGPAQPFIDPRATPPRPARGGGGAGRRAVRYVSPVTAAAAHCAGAAAAATPRGRAALGDPPPPRPGATGKEGSGARGAPL